MSAAHQKPGPPYVTEQDDQTADPSAYFICANRNKRPSALDFSKSGGKKPFENLPLKLMCWWSFLNPRALTKFGLDYTRLKKQAPRIVYCSISGLGQGGPNAKKPTAI